MKIAVFCGSGDGDDPAFAAAAEATGREVGRRGWRLVYGGGSVGLMGRVARATQAAGGAVTGVIPRAMMRRELAFEASDELVVVETMRERKQVMDDRADAFVVLPGGFGTLEEVAEVVTHRFLNYHNKPVVIVDVAGFWSPLRTLFDHFEAARFAGPAYREAYRFVATAEEALAALDAVVPADREASGPR
ncbi:LOG family protein [Phycisphaera mikurensis]|uniref:Cytokinin riboside 5'-monophosphate phosphoribohydrolase n=1 Tax=Phycisphaera mikurensis (strain NBRC 102666 / KCTC 22515 / FYK2301M01) TaxID=1142394 RepID=I0IJ96_PHYMF|nr:TIGR00730 family Rossman fold protein [Phycisphaera mikurensis]MBB6441866.1 hypothetical protein [Phycisphaera mikurensis]BAM05334.1 LOG family protein [Phycisphaera mikurensis NBRC 102666]